MPVATLTVPPPPLTLKAADKAGWTFTEKFLFRVLFLFTILLIVPLEPEWYARFADSRSFFWYLSSLTGYRPNFLQLQSESGRWGLGGYATWGVAALIAIAGALVWSLIAIKSNRTNYNALYYWTRVAIRYRIALGLIAFGLLKVYPMQMPYPSLSNLVTDFGDYNAYKIYWQHVGVSQWYEILLGWVEVIGGVLMFFRATTFLGALINAGVLFNIAHANFAYDGGVHVYSSFFVLFSLILLTPYFVNLWKVFVLKKDVTPVTYYPFLDTGKKKIFYYSVKFSFIFLFTVVYATLRYNVHYEEHYLKEPASPGLTGAAGYYNVTEFKLNDKVLPYDPLDSVRWQNVVFEPWSTVVYKVNKAFPVSQGQGTPSLKDIDRNYELAGIAGGRRFLYYEADTVKNVLRLWDKNGRRSGEDGNARSNTSKKGKQKSKGEKIKEEKPKEEKPLFTWLYERPEKTRIILHGINENKDSIHVVLDKVDRQFPIQAAGILFNR